MSAFCVLFLFWLLFAFVTCLFCREDEAVVQQQQHFPAWIMDIHPARLVSSSSRDIVHPLCRQNLGSCQSEVQAGERSQLHFNSVPSLEYSKNASKASIMYKMCKQC